MNNIDLNNKSNKIKVLIISMTIFTLSIIGISYAYFNVQITGNDTASSMRVKSTKKSLVYNDVQISSGSNTIPGWSETKTLTVTNNGRTNETYTIIWKDILNTIINDELVISATCTASSGTCDAISEKIIPTYTTQAHNVKVKRNISIAPGVTHTYTVTIVFKDTGSNQDYNQRKHINGTLNIVEGADEHPLYDVMKTLATAGTYATTYSGTSNDTYGETGTKTIYYIKPKTTSDVSTLLNKINVKFAGYCWQILRTTDTGGVKLIYNGEPDSNGYCKAINTQDTHRGVIASNGSTVAMSGDYQYADSYTYNLIAGTFTLVNPSQDNYANNKNLIGKYTCKTSSSTTTCSTLYYLNTPNRADVNSPYTVTYTIGDTQNAQLGKTPFNANYRSPAYVGYKYGTPYDFAGSTDPTSGSIMGHDVYWNGSNYELREANNSVSSGTEYDTNHHYTCNSASSTCTGGKVRYYYYGNYYYIELLNGDDIDTALTRMLESNTYDSAMKSYLENWFRNKMLAYKDYLDENTVYCNDRTIAQIGGWTNTGGIGKGDSNYLKFSNYSTSLTDLSCTKDTDKFSVGNSNAELNYPVGLATAPEMNIITNATLRTTGQQFWLMSPRSFSNDSYADGRCVSSGGGMGSNRVAYTYGVRPVVSLAPSNIPISGTGAYDNPYIIEE